MNREQKTTAEKMKLLRGKHTYKNYSELCEALCLTPAKRGKDRAEQKAAIAQQYRIEEHKNGSYTIEKINQETRREMKRQEKRENGVIVEIDGHEVDLTSNHCYQHTMIDKYIDYTIFRLSGRRIGNQYGTYDPSLTSKSNLWTCVFSRSKLYQDLLKPQDGKLFVTYPTESLEYIDSVIMPSLFNQINHRLEVLESRGWISVCHMYRIGNRGDENVEFVDAAEVQPSVDYALRELGFANEYVAFCSDRRQQYIDLRNQHYKDQTGQELGSKAIEITSLIPLDDDSDYTDCEGEDEEDRPCTNLSNRDIQIILTAFFDILREKQLRKIDDEAARHFGDVRRKKVGRVTRKNAGKTRELVETYCAYATVPSQNNGYESTAFYSLDELVEYYEINLNDPTLTLDFSELVKCKTYTCDWIPPANDLYPMQNWTPDWVEDEDEIPEFKNGIPMNKAYYAIGNYLNNGSADD